MLRKSQKQSSRNVNKVSLRPPSSQTSNRMSRSNLSPKADNSYDLDLNNERASSFVRKSTMRTTMVSSRKISRRSTNRIFSVGALIQIYRDEQYLPGIVKRINSDKSYAVQYLYHGLKKFDPYVLRKDLIERDKFEAYQFEYPPLRVGDFVDSLHIYLKGQITKIHQDSNTYRITNQYGSVKDHVPRHLLFKYDESKSQYDSERESYIDNQNTIHFINNAVSTLNSIEEGEGEYEAYDDGVTPVSSTYSSKPTTAEESKPTTADGSKPFSSESSKPTTADENTMRTNTETNDMSYTTESTQPTTTDTSKPTTAESTAPTTTESSKPTTADSTTIRTNTENNDVSYTTESSNPTTNNPPPITTTESEIPATTTDDDTYNPSSTETNILLGSKYEEEKKE